jgi:hypothetical protein
MVIEDDVIPLEVSGCMIHLNDNYQLQNDSIDLSNIS